MTFFYDLNKRLAELAKPQTTQLNERDEGKPGKNFEKIAKDAGERYGSKAAGERVAGAVRNKLKAQGKLEEQEMDESAFQAAIGKKKYGDEGMKALQKAGREHASAKTMSNIRNKYDKYDESQGMTDEGNAFSKAVVDAKRDGIQPGEKIKVGGKEMPLKEKMSPAKQKSFAALAPPRDKITFADKIAGAKKEVDEMLGDVAAEAMKAAVGKMQVTDESRHDDDDDVYAYLDPSKAKTHKTASGGTVTRHGGVTRHQAAPGHYGGYDPETDPDKDDDKPGAPAGEKRGRGRPKGTGKSIGAKGPSGKSKLMTKEEIDEAIAALEGCGYSVSKLEEKAVSKKQQKFMGMVHAAQKGEKPASKEVAKVAKTMKKSDAEDFAATKHKGLPEKKKKKEVEETTVAGSVATSAEPAKDPGASKPKKSSGSMAFGKGVYEGAIAESFDKKLGAVLSEGMNVNMSTDSEGHQSLTVTATDEDAAALADMLKMAGLGQSSCGCDHIDEELANSPQPEYSDTDTMVNTLSGGLNGKKTDQSTLPVLNQNPQRTVGSVAESRLWELYNRYETK